MSKKITSKASEMVTGLELAIATDRRKDELIEVHILPIQEELSNIEVQTHELLEALKAVKAYDKAIMSEAFQQKSIIQGDSLDVLYADFITKTNNALDKAEED